MGLQELGYTHKQDYQIIGEGNLSYSKMLDFSTIDFMPAEIGSEVIDYILSDQGMIDVAKEPRLINR